MSSSTFFIECLYQIWVLAFEDEPSLTPGAIWTTFVPGVNSLTEDSVLRKLILIACIASIGSLFASGSVGAQADSTRNSTVAAFDFESPEPDQFQISVQVEDDGGSSLSDQNYALGMLVPFATQDGDQRTTLFVGLETFDGGRWATLVVNYDDQVVFDAGSFQIPPDVGLVPFVDSVDNERRVARTFDWSSGESFDFVLTRTVGTAGTLWSAEMVSGESVLSLGSQLLPVEVGALTGTAYSVVQRTNFSAGCNDASYLRARLGQVSSVEGGVVSPAFMSSGWVETGSCPGSSVSVAGSDTVIHELGGLEGFLDGALGTDTQLFGDYIVGLAENSDYPSCLANLVDGGFRRVCFAESDGESPSARDLSIAAIVDSPSRPPGETIWIGRFDEEVVAP